MSTLIKSLVGKGLQDRIMTTLRSMQCVDNVSFFTVADIAAEMILRMHPGVTPKVAEFSELKREVNTRLVQAERGGSSEIHRSHGKLSSKIAGRFCSTNKAAYGYRIGAPMTALVNADTFSERKFVQELVEETQKKPLEAICKLLPCLSTNQLSELISLAVSEKDKKHLQLLSDLDELTRKINQI